MYHALLHCLAWGCGASDPFKNIRVNDRSAAQGNLLLSQVRQRERKSAKSIHTYNAYNLSMSAVKRIPVTEPVWKDLAEMRSAGQTYTDLLAEMIEDRKKRRLEEDVGKWSSRKKKDYVSLSEIKD